MMHGQKYIKKKIQIYFP